MGSKSGERGRRIVCPRESTSDHTTGRRTVLIAKLMGVAGTQSDGDGGGRNEKENLAGQMRKKKKAGKCRASVCPRE